MFSFKDELKPGLTSFNWFTVVTVNTSLMPLNLEENQF